MVGISSPGEVIEGRLIGGAIGGNKTEAETEQMEEAGKAQVEINWKEAGMMKDRWRAQGVETKEPCERETEEQRD